jgi:Cu(I)/Ag(I) efflux system periplasmic protein CusF
MKRHISIFAAVALMVAFVPSSRAQSGDMKGMDMGGDKKSPTAQVQAQAHKASGTVTRVDRAGGRVTIAHGPVTTLKWPAMTMTFGVKEKALIDKLPSGKKVDFEFVKQGSDYVVTSVR